VPSNSS